MYDGMQYKYQLISQIFMNKDSLFRNNSGTCLGQRRPSSRRAKLQRNTF